MSINTLPTSCSSILLSSTVHVTQETGGPTPQTVEVGAATVVTGARWCLQLPPPRAVVDFFAFSAFQRGRIIIIGLQQARLEVAVENIEIEIGDKYNYSVYAYCC